MKRPSLQYWRKQLRKNPNWVPNHKKDPEAGQVFTPKQQTHLVGFGKSINEDTHLSVTYDLFSYITTNYYNNLPDDKRRYPNLNFNCSDHYISKFLKRNGLSCRRAHSKRRPDISAETIAQFREEAQHIFQTVEWNHIANCDETFWRVAALSNRTMTPTNSDNITIDPGSDEKKGFLSWQQF